MPDRLTASPEATEAGVTVPTAAVPEVPAGTVMATVVRAEVVAVVKV